MSFIRTGCPIWTHEQWFGSLFPANTAKEQSLAAYAKHFNSVEGNTSFYHIPDEKTIKRWAEQVPHDFRFTFKFHRSISHDKKLLNIEDDLHLVLNRMALLGDKLGCLMLQLPASFSPHQLDTLAHFIQLLPKDFCYAIEVRHLGFFDKSDNEKAFNQLLIENNINRVIMDTRALFACPANGDKIIEDAHRKKPKVPTNVIATSDTPLVRFVGHPVIEANKPFYTPWIHKTKQWLDEGKSPYLFFHMANTFDAPWLAEAFFNDFTQLYPDISLPSMTLTKNHINQLDIFGN
ncbi:MAG: hypothetical protein ACJASL_002272 [Paraglaciecola sp.]